MSSRDAGLTAIVAALRAAQFAFANEAELHGGIAAALTTAGIAFVHEAVLSAGERPDFLAGRVGIEVKIGGSAANVARQLSRYLQLDSIDAVLLVTTHMRMARAMPAELHGKQVRAYFVGGAL